jgi:hypothetical protein
MAVIETIPRSEWATVADRIERLARQDKCLGRYRQLIRDLRRGVFGERCSERAEAALQQLLANPSP